MMLRCVHNYNYALSIAQTSTTWVDCWEVANPERGG